MAKKCTSCAKDLPDQAPFCAFCGAKQAMAPAAMPPQGANAKTVLGYSAADLLKNLPGGAPRPGAPAAPPQQFAPPPAAPPQQFAPPPQQFAPPPAAPPPQQFAPPPQQFAPPPQQFAPPPPAQGGQFGGSATAATMFMQNAPQIPVQPAQPAPAPYQPPPQPMPSAGSFPQMGQQGGFPPPQQQGGFPPPQQQPGYPPPQQPGYPPPQPMGMPGGGMSNPYGAQPMGAPGQPPFLASQTAARLNKPVEPFNDITKLALLVFGGCLLALFIVPLSLSPLIMTVTTIGDAPGATKLAPILIGVGGVLGVLLAMMPLQPMQRGLFAAALGLVPILLFGTFVLGGFDWHLLVFPIGGILVPSGLFLRDQYPSDKLPRLFVFIGAACIGIPFFVPFQLVQMIKGILASLVHPAQLITILGAFVPLVLAALAVLLALIPGQTKFGAKQLAWAWFAFPIAFTIAHLTADGSIVSVLTHQPGQLFAWAGPPGMTNAAAAASAMHAAADAANSADALKAASAAVNVDVGLPLFTAFAGMATFGICTLFGKQLEMSK